MKKTLFLSAILGAALCSPAFAAQTGWDNGGAAHYCVDETAAATLIINNGQGNKNTEKTFDFDILNDGGTAGMDKELAGLYLHEGQNVSIVQSIWGNHKIFGTLTLDTISVANGGVSGCVTVKDGNGLAVKAVEGALGGVNVTSGSSLTLGTAESNITLAGTINNSGTLAMNGTITLASDLSNFEHAAIDAKDDMSVNGMGNTKTTIYYVYKGSTAVAPTAFTTTETLTQDGNNVTIVKTDVSDTYFAVTGTVTDADLSGTGAVNLLLMGGNATIGYTGDYQSGAGFITGSVVVNGGSTLTLTGHDALGYNDSDTKGYTSSATDSIVLNGTDSTHKAVMVTTNGQTMTADLFLNGYAEVSGGNSANGSLNSFHGDIYVTGTDNTIAAELKIRTDFNVDVAADSALTISGKVSYFGERNGTLTKTGGGTLTITGDITGGTINGGSSSKTTIRDNTISGGSISNATISNSTISGVTLDLRNVTLNNNTYNGNVTLSGGQQVLTYSNRTITLANGAEVNAATNYMWLNSGATLTLRNTTVDGTTTGGSVSLKGILFGVSGNTSNAGHLNIAEQTMLTITGTATAPSSTAGSDSGFIIWNGSAHTINVNGSLVIEDGIRAEKYGNTAATSSSEVYNIGAHGLLRLNKGITYVSNSNVSTMGTINVNGGTLAIGGQTSGSKAKAVNLSDKSKVVAIDANTSTEQVFTLNDRGTVTFSGKGLDGTANNTLTVKGTINNSTAAVDSIGKVTFGDMTTKSLMVDGYTTVGALETSSVDMKDQSTLMLKSTYDATKLTVAADASAKLFVQTVEANTGVGHAATHHVGSVVINDNATLTFGGANAKVDSLTLGNGATLTLGDNNTHNYNFTTSSLTVEGNSTINANLVVTDNGTMDFSNHTELTMGCTVSIGDHVTIKIDETELASIVNTGAVLVIITDVEGVDTDNLALTLGSDWKFVDSHDQSLDAYNLRLDVVDAGNGKYNIVVAPEPATATLSLLALAALTARRRRH